MKIETFKLNLTTAMLNKPQPLAFKNAPQAVASIWPANGTVSFVVDETAPPTTCIAFVTTSGAELQGGVIGQIGLNLFVTSDCFI